MFVLGTATHAGYDHILGQLKEAAAKYKGILVLTDPDVAGRQARNLLDTKLEGCWHAFVPVLAATAQAAIRSKEQGDIGIEHARPEVIIEALKRATQSKPQRAEFSRERLQQLGLINPMHEMVRGKVVLPAVLPLTLLYISETLYLEGLNLIYVFIICRVEM